MSRNSKSALSRTIVVYHMLFSALALAVCWSALLVFDWTAGSLTSIVAAAGMSLLPLACGAWLVHRRLAALSEIEAQLRQMAAHEEGLPLKQVPTRDGATLGWNRLAQFVQNEASTASLAQRLESALASRGYSEVESAVESISDGLVVTDMEGRITFANRAVAALLAADLGEETLEQKCIFELLKGDDENARGLLDPSAAARTLVGEVAPRSGGDCTLRAARHPLLGKDHQAGYVWSIRDVTQQRLADQMRDQFLDSATHELRTPLANIKAYAETLALDDMLDVECQKEFCNTINAEATRLARLIDDLLDLSSIEVGSLSITPQNVELDRLLREVIDKVKPLMEQKELEFEVALPEKIPEMQLDKDKMATTLVNLLGNAAKYTLPGGRVTLRVKLAHHELHIDVEDTGVGIPPGDLPRVFDKFFRGDDPRVQQETGTGLGLSLAREIVRLHGGDLTVHSEFDKGSTFTVILPLKGGA